VLAYRRLRFARAGLGLGLGRLPPLLLLHIVHADRRRIRNAAVALEPEMIINDMEDIVRAALG
jgi:hypothetical protein